MKKRIISIIAGAALLLTLCPVNTMAAFDTSVEAAYNTAVQGQDTLDGLDVTVTEYTVSAATNITAEKEVELKVSGIKGTALKADIAVNTQEGDAENYYRDGYYYTDTSGGKVKQQMERADIWNVINSHVYLDLTSNYLKLLCAKENDDKTTDYTFAATTETLGDYSKKFLEGSEVGQGLVIDSLQGTMQTDADGHVTKRSLQVVYTVTKEDQPETFLMQTEVVFHEIGQVVNVSLPDLSEYKEKASEKPVETITPISRTIYATNDINVRAAGNLSAVILGGLTAGSGIAQTGYTSDGWIQIQYNGAAGYVWGDYVSTTKPILTTNSSGTMYATADVNVRNTYSSDGAILGTLSKGSPVEISGTTSNGWIRVKYNGTTGYVYGDYLSWKVPVVDTYVKDGSISGTITDASFGSLTITRDDGQGSMTFNTTYAQLSLQDTLYTGDWVEVKYSGAGTPYTASLVTDYTSHEDSAEAQSVSEEGVVTSYEPDQMQVLCSDGINRSFNVADADLEMADGLYEGKYVIVTWMSKTNGAETKNIDALRVKGE